ncbi:hypothetical protein A9W97_15350 [Mycobacterium gordonae]|nr:hypothetical protein [Mycobacterium gordonae]OBJ88708.1 hypothetical protein A9W97_15350 [Mycobacterium gordonae]
MTPEDTPRTLEDEVRRLRAGIVRRPPSTRDPGESEMVRVVSAAALAWDGQLDRVDRFSRPLLPSATLNEERANPAMTSQLFLEQVASDYRRVASCSLDLREVEARRNTAQGTRILEHAGVANRPVAPLAVGQHLAGDERAADLASVVAPWLVSTAELDSQCVAAFGDVLGPLVQAALNNSRADTSIGLPSWSKRVGEMWCQEFLAAGAEILNCPALLSRSHIDGRGASRQDSADITETTNAVVALAETFRRVADVRVSVTGHLPKIGLVLAGDALSKDELDRLAISAQNIPAEVTILPS